MYLVPVGLPVVILLPQQQQRHAAATRLALNRLPVRQRPRRVALLARRKQAAIELLIAQRAQLLRVQPAGGDALHVVLHRRPGQPHTAGDLAVIQPHLVFQPQHFLDPAHQCPSPRHPPLPAKGSDVTRDYSPARRDPRPEAGANSPRPEVPVCCVIHCRFRA